MPRFLIQSHRARGRARQQSKSWRVGEYWLSLRDLTKLNIGHRQRRDDPTDVWPPPAATSWDQCLVHPKSSICSKASHYGRQNANYLLHVSGGCARTPANNNDWGYRWGYSLFVTFMTFATFATFAKSIKHRPKSIKHSPAASRPANQKPLKISLAASRPIYQRIYQRIYQKLLGVIRSLRGVLPVWVRGTAQYTKTPAHANCSIHVAVWLSVHLLIVQLP